MDFILARRRLGLTQGQLAEKAGVTQSTVSLWERGVTRPTVTLLPKLAEVYGVSMEELACETKQQTEGAK